MKELEFEVTDWIGDAGGDPVAEVSLGSLRIRAGQEGIWLTEVEDTIARSVRRHINVSLHCVAVWLLADWWRLRWEPRPAAPTPSWRLVHSMAGLGSGYAWPDIEFSSQGEHIQVRIAAESSADVAAIRYLRNAIAFVPAADFESAVDSLIDQVEGRLRSCAVGAQDLAELRKELLEERRQPVLARACKLQALAGRDPGSVAPDWLEAAETLATEAGSVAAEEVLAVLPSLQGSFDVARCALDAVKGSPTSVDLSWIGDRIDAGPATELPWEKGVRVAGVLRSQMRLNPGPLANDVMEEWLGTRLPLRAEPQASKSVVQGAYRSSGAQATPVLVAGRHINSQRFNLARLIGCVAISPADERLLPITGAGTALQKFERSFAQELLCPWNDLDAFTNENGTHEAGIAEAAEHFAVSDWLVRSTLVNKGKLSRTWLPQS